MQEISELASEGERLCKSGNCIQGLKYFQSALNIYHNSRLVNMQDMDDQDQLRLLQMLSIIYNQMGNAYFYLQDYQKALDCHKKDLDLSEKFEDESGKAKACGNIGNTLQLLGDYDEAILYSLRNLEISKRLNDTVSLLICFES
jgi:G-protein signaling modulator 2